MILPIPGLPWPEPYANLTIARDLEMEAQQGPDSGHWYKASVSPNPMPSVTTLLEILHRGPGLLNWSKRIVADTMAQQMKTRPEDRGPNWLQEIQKDACAEPDRLARQAAQRGTLVHEAIEQHLLGHKSLEQIPEAHRYAVQEALAFLEDGELTPLASETSVFHPNRLYAGQVDCIARHEDGQLVVIDWKTGSRLYAHHEYQAAAYAAAVSLLARENVGHAYVVKLPLSPNDRNPRYQKRKVADIFARYDVFKAAQELWNLTRKEEGPL